MLTHGTENLRRLKEDGSGVYRDTPFVTLVTNLNIARVRGRYPATLDRSWNAVVNTLNDILVTIHRLSWQHYLYTQDQLPMELWLRFGGADIASYHVEARALFDYAACVIANLTGRPKNLPNTSFQDLHTGITKGKYAKLINAELKAFILAANWFGDLRDVRDDIVHRDADSLVFPNRETILFQVHRGFERRIVTPELMHNANLVDFQKYGSLLSGRLLQFTDDLASIALNISGLEIITNGKHHHPGYRNLRDWAFRLSSPAKEGSSPVENIHTAISTSFGKDKSMYSFPASAQDPREPDNSRPKA